MKKDEEIIENMKGRIFEKFLARKQAKKYFNKTLPYSWCAVSLCNITPRAEQYSEIF